MPAVLIYITVEAISKFGFWSKIEAGTSFNPQSYSLYFEDLKLVPNNEIGRKNIFKIAS